jgi:DNA-binding response OmpR family regulator
LLIIEDNADVRSYLQSILDTNYILLQAVNGEEGIRQAKSFIPDLIISDVMMPKMDGYEACRRLKKDEKTSHIPVILLTAKSSVDSRIEGLETEADLFLNKPFIPRELLLCVHNLIESRKKLRERYNRQMVLKPSDIAVNSMDELFLQRLMKVVEANFEDENFTVEQLSAEMAMSRSQLHRKLHALTNESCSQFIRTFRLQRAMELLKRKSASVSEIAFKVGFSSPSYFNKCFVQQFGCIPSSVSEGVTADSK